MAHDQCALDRLSAGEPVAHDEVDLALLFVHRSRVVDGRRRGVISGRFASRGGRGMGRGRAAKGRDE